MPKKWSKLIFTVRKWKFLQILNCVHKLQYLNFFFNFRGNDVAASTLKKVYEGFDKSSKLSSKEVGYTTILQKFGDLGVLDFWTYTTIGKFIINTFYLYQT